MVQISISRQHFVSRDDALREIIADGYWPLSWMDPPGAEYPAHYHRCDETLYLLNGTIEITDESVQATFVLSAGDRLFLPAELVHSVSCPSGATCLQGLRELVPFAEHFIRAT